MLDLLVNYAKTHGITIEPGFKPKTIRWVIICDQAGRFLNVQELGNSSDKNNRGKAFNVCPDLSQPEMKAAGSGCRHFLVDNIEVVALMGKNGDVLTDKTIDEKYKKKAKAKHDFFISLLRQGAGAMKDLDVLADLLDSADSLSTIQHAFTAQRFKPTDSVTFAVAGRAPMFLVEDNAWHDWWRNFRQSLLTKKIAKKNIQEHNSGGPLRTVKSMRCFGSGRLVEPVLTHPKIEGLSDVGGLSMGDTLAGFKQESFCSYFLAQSENAAVSEDIAAAYRGGLNDLIKYHSRRLTGAKVVHWYAGENEVPDELDPLNWLADVEDTDTNERDAQNRARSLLESIHAGGRSDLLEYRFYSLTLSGASGRVMIRDWIEGQFGELSENIDKWFDDLAIVRRDGDSLAPRPKFLAVLGGLVRDLKDISPPVETKMWRVAVRYESIPEFVMAQALARVRVDIIQDQPMNHARMGVLKAYHIRKGDKNMQPYLNEQHPDAAYHCGRLMAVLAEIQREALGDVGAGVIQRYYAAASATPALVLGRLVRTSNYHLEKINYRKKREGLKDLFTGIWCSLKDKVPSVLKLEDQSVFALGFYQQSGKLASIDWGKYEYQFTPKEEGVNS